jgi:hypothetical protein
MGRPPRTDKASIAFSLSDGLPLLPAPFFFLSQQAPFWRQILAAASRHPFLDVGDGDAESAARFWERGHGERGVVPDNPTPPGSLERPPAPSESLKPRPLAVPICPRPVMLTCVDRSISVVSCTRSTTASVCRQARVCCPCGCRPARTGHVGFIEPSLHCFQVFPSVLLLGQRGCRIAGHSTGSGSAHAGCVADPPTVPVRWSALPSGRDAASESSPSTTPFSPI